MGGSNIMKKYGEIKGQNSYKDSEGYEQLLNPNYLKTMEQLDKNKFLDNDDMEILDEAGNISSGIALKKHNDVLKYGKQILKSRDSRDVDKMLARMIASSSSLSLMAVAVGGDSSFVSTIAKGASLRGL